MMTDRIFAPNLYLCAYHLREDDTQGETHPLWLNCDRLLRKMKDLLMTINININNYNETIERICARLGLDKEELSFWRYFGEETAPQFRGQIEANLSYFEQGTGLISQAVVSIRAIVEIDQAQCDRTWQRWEKKRDKRQQYLQKKAEDKAKAEQEKQEQANQKLQDQIQYDCRIISKFW